MSEEWIDISIPCLRGNELKNLKECIETNFVSSIGPFIDKFERNISKIISDNGIKSVATSSGTTALELGLISYGVMPNDLVMIPSYTFIATANAISHIGASPWLINVDKNFLTLDPIALQKELKENTYKKLGYSYHKKTEQKISCIVPVHVFGHSADLDKIKVIADEFSIPVLQDSACGIGSKYKDKKLGENNISGIISFNGNKTITTGAGGIFYSEDEEKIKLVKHLSSTAKCSGNYDHDMVGFNYRMSNIQAALGLAQLEQLKIIIEEKRIIHEEYKKYFSNIEGFRLIESPDWSYSTYWINAIILENEQDSKKLLDTLNQAKIRSKYFWKPLHFQIPYAESLKGDLKGLETIHKKIIQLPSSPNLSTKNLKKVIDKITNFFS